MGTIPSHEDLNFLHQICRSFSSTFNSHQDKGLYCMCPHIYGQLYIYIFPPLYLRVNYQTFATTLVADYYIFALIHMAGYFTFCPHSCDWLLYYISLLVIYLNQQKTKCKVTLQCILYLT